MSKIRATGPGDWAWAAPRLAQLLSGPTTPAGFVGPAHSTSRWAICCLSRCTCSSEFVAAEGHAPPGRQRLIRPRPDRATPSGDRQARHRPSVSSLLSRVSSFAILLPLELSRAQAPRLQSASRRDQRRDPQARSQQRAAWPPDALVNVSADNSPAPSAQTALDQPLGENPRAYDSAFSRSPQNIRAARPLPHW